MKTHLPPSLPGQIGDHDWVSQASITRCESTEWCQDFFDLLGNGWASYLPRVGRLRGDSDLAVSALSGLSPRGATASRLGRAYSMVRSGERWSVRAPVESLRSGWKTYGTPRMDGWSKSQEQPALSHQSSVDRSGCQKSDRCILGIV